MRFRTELLLMLPDRSLEWIQRATERVYGWLRGKMDEETRLLFVRDMVEKSRDRPDFNDRVFACEPRKRDENQAAELILLSGFEIRPADRLLHGQHTEGGPAWLLFSTRAVWWVEQKDRAFREAALWRTVHECQRKPDFNDRVFVCESDEGPILTPGRHLTPTDKVLLGQQTTGGPAWLQFSETTTVRWPDEEDAP